MPAADTAELKRRLRGEGFEIYRTLEGRVLLAERVRDNLIMDSGVAAGPMTGDSDALYVFVTIRAQLSHFPGSGADAVLSHAWSLARPFQERGYAAGEPATSEMRDPSRPDRTLDTILEIPLSRQLDDPEGLLTELRIALSLPRSSNDG